MSCWEVLGLDAEADERTIKRQYARLLKGTRPDEDPEAFQALREAYEQALNWVQWRAESQDGAVPEVEPPADVSPLPVTPEGIELPVPVQALCDERPQRLAELLAGLRPSLLTARRLEAEAAGLAVAFERGVLHLCLEEEYSSVLREAACAEYRWLEVTEAPALTALELQPLYARIVQSHLLSLRQLHNDGEPAALVEGLRTLAGQPWLQSYDARALLESSVVSMLLEMPSWSCDTLDRVASIFAWQEGQRDANCPEPLWQALLRRRDAEAYFAQLLRDAQTWDLRPELRAARLMLTPFDHYQRLRFSADFGSAEWTCCQQIADTLQYRYPHLLQRLPEAQRDLAFWRDLPRCAPDKEPGRLKLWLVMVFVLSMTWLPHQWSRMHDPVALLTGLLVFGTGAYVGAGIFLHALRALTDNRLNRFDYWLSAWLPAGLHGQGSGVRPLRLNLGSWAVGLLVSRGLELPAWGAASCAGITLLVWCLNARLHPLRRAWVALQSLWSKYHTWMIAAGVVIGIAIFGCATYEKLQVERRAAQRLAQEAAEHCRKPASRNDADCIVQALFPRYPALAPR